MASRADNGGGSSGWRIARWSVPALLLAVPAVANFPWTASDYVVMAVMLFGSVGIYELVARTSRNLAYRGGAAVAVLAAFLLVWVNLAVGFLGDEDNPANLMFAGVLALALAGAMIARFRAAGMANAMLATFAAQVLVGAYGYAAGLGSPGWSGIYEAAMGTTLFGGLWLIAAALFHKAARDGSD